MDVACAFGAAKRGRELVVLAALVAVSLFRKGGPLLATGTGVRARWVADEGSGNSDHREFGLAGLTAGKLGVPNFPSRHTAADRAGRLRPGAFARVRRLLEALLRAS